MLKPRPGTEVWAGIHGRLTLVKENADAASVSAKEVRPRTFAHQLSETPQPSQLPRVSAGTSFTTTLWAHAAASSAAKDWHRGDMPRLAAGSGILHANPRARSRNSDRRVNTRLLSYMDGSESHCVDTTVA